MNNFIQSPSPVVIGQLVRSIRRAQFLTQADLALAAGVSTPFLSALENGKPTVRLDVLVRVLNTLNIQMGLSLPNDIDKLSLKILSEEQGLDTGLT